MELIEDTGFAKELLTGLLERNRGESRKDHTPHLSELIYCLTKSYYSRGNSKAGTVEDKSRSAKELTMFAIGTGLETVLLRPYGEPKEGEFEGVRYQADTVTHESGLPVEFKSTRMSVKRFVGGDMPLGYYRQILGYMKTQGTLRAKLVAIFIIPAELMAWECVATEDEVESNWAWVQDRKRVYMEHLEKGEAPQEFTWNEPWECDGCGYKLLCDMRLAQRQTEAIRGQGGPA